MFLESSPVTTWSEEVSRPQVHPTAYIHHTAVIIGDVRIEKNVIIFPGVVLRADEGSPIIIREGSNIQDRVIMHCLQGSSIEIGARCSIAHGAVVHGPCVIGGETFVGFNSVVHEARLGEKCFVSHCALVTGVHLPGLAMVPAGKMLQTQDEVAFLPEAGGAERSFLYKVLSVNEELRRGYKNINHLEVHHQEHRARIKRPAWEGAEGKEALTVG
ncbi:MAG: transferase [Firmicutes bacterium]|nr:transferase [Bacillota bacterium]MCL5056469.1 transferase [Actinomycetota bacterium]